MVFAQLTGRESLRDIEVCLRAHQAKLYHLGIRSRISRSTLADANEHRHWRIYRRFCPSPDFHRTASVCQRAARRGTGRDRLRTGLHHH
jgi:hypothetical protein